jgi:chromosome segregation ATPase
MRHSLLFVFCFLLLSASGLGQSTASESQGMQALVAEVRQLRKDLQTTNGNALKAQILLYRLQAQEATVARISGHLNDVRARLAETQERRRAVTASLKRNEEFIDNAGAAEISPVDRKQVQFEISRLKTELENLATEEQQRQSAEMEAEEQLRTEQAKLSGLEDRMDRLEKGLDNPR